MKAKSKQKEILLDETIARFCLNLLYCHCLLEPFHCLTVTSLLIYLYSGSDLTNLEFKHGRKHCTYLKLQPNALKSNSELSV